jgi:SET domain-containing protein
MSKLTQPNTMRKQTWTDPRQEIRSSPIQGNGIFARAAIHQGESVEIIGGQVMMEAEFETLQRNTPRYNAVQIGEGRHLVELPENTSQRAGSLNHSCDANLWLADEVTLVARREIAAGEELTVDYALFTTHSQWVLDQPCRCGASVCRTTITGNDWKLPDVQERYRNHFSPFLNERIAELKS